MPPCVSSSSGFRSGGRSTTKVPLTVGPVRCMAASHKATLRWTQRSSCWQNQVDNKPCLCDHQRPQFTCLYMPLTASRKPKPPGKEPMDCAGLACGFRFSFCAGMSASPALSAFKTGPAAPAGPAAGRPGLHRRARAWMLGARCLPNACSHSNWRIVHFGKHHNGMAPVVVAVLSEQGFIAEMGLQQAPQQPLILAPFAAPWVLVLAAAAVHCGLATPGQWTACCCQRPALQHPVQCYRVQLITRGALGCACTMLHGPKPYDMELPARRRPWCC